jgi:hypothetical protein
MEQRLELRYALDVSPTAVTVAAERICCMRESESESLGCGTASGPGRYCRMLRSVFNLNALNTQREDATEIEKMRCIY